MYRLYPFLALSACITLQASYPCLNGKSAKRIAELATGGEAVRAQKVPHNGSIHAWEVLVHMPKQEQGWRITIDRDNSRILKRERVDNPASRKPHD